ncbi:MAG: hypothetical protein JF887_03800 [Candidatus Dormibacteraeota bacterium]|uniref:Secreted protein n=1 Tax=Candidatus Amunia macphersoniae TaxID=3127014 RepID=A0A934N917_9BACT|nr:hypothetical protein [Candidatus Dormibacteraeota bacterium]
MRRALLLAALLCVCGCGSSPPPSTPSASVDPRVRAAAAQAYTAAAATANAAKASLQAGPCTRSDNPSLKACSSGLAAVEQTYENALLAITFPSDAQADANALVAIDKKVIAEEQAFAASANPQADSADFSAIEQDDSRLAAAVAALRRDLGLSTAPPLGATPTP